MKKIKCSIDEVLKMKDFVSIVMMIFSSIGQVYVIQTFMNPSNLLPSGFTGVALLLSKIASVVHINLSASLCILILNIPAALLCYRGISRRFTFLSCLQFSMVSLGMKIFTFEPLLNDLVLNVLFGGFLYGICVSMALKANGSTGGTDFIAVFIANKLQKSIWDYVFLFNCIILIIFGLMFGWIYAGYSIVFQFISTQTINHFYHRYEQVTIEVTTTDPDSITSSFVSHFHHGMSVIQAYGAYSKKTFFICTSVISTYEEEDAVRCIKNSDPKAIIKSYKTSHFYGNFYRSPI